jgi:sulfur carrier protein
MEITLNGEPHAISDESTLFSLVDSLGLVGQGVAVAVNRQIVQRQAWQARVLISNDAVDIVRAIGGG